MVKHQFPREVPGVGLLLVMLFGFSLLGFLTADEFCLVVSSPRLDDNLVSLAPVNAGAALRVENVKSREVLAVATSIAYKAREMRRELSAEDLERVVQAVFEDEKLEVSTLVDFAALLHEMNVKLDEASRMRLGLQIITDE